MVGDRRDARRSMKTKEMRFSRCVKLPEKGPFEFQAWEKAAFMGIEQRDHNGKVTRPHLVFSDCPAGKQITYRMLVLQGQSQVPMDEDWVPMALVFKTPKGFGSLWLSTSSSRRKKVPDRGEEKGTVVEPDIIVGANAG